MTSIARALALAALLWVALAAGAQPSKPQALAVQPAQASPVPARGNPSFVLVNRSGRTIQAAFASLSTERNWGEDRLGANVVLPPGQRFDVRLPEGPCEWDLRVVYDDTRREDRMRQNLCAVTEVVFDGSDAQAGSPGGSAAAPPPARGNPSFVLVNRSSRTIQAAFASLSTERNWGEDRLGASVVLPPGQRFALRLPEGPCEWDLRVVYDDARREDKMRQNLCAVTEVVFDGSDARVGQGGAAGGGAAPPARPALGYGSGFFVSAQGHMLTNAHVAGNCRRLSVLIDNQRLDAHLVRKDDTNDLALLRVSMRQAPAFARFRAGPPVRAGDDIVVAGFPLPTVLQNGLNITTGNISAMAGLGSNTALMQITAPVQPGNSGGPLLDLAGNVVGVIVSKLDAQRIARVTGDIPQNVNFAIQGAVARLFLESSGVRVPEASSAREARAADVGEASRGYTHQIECQS